MDAKPIQSQLSAASVPANIAEGSARGPGKEFIRGLRIARGSLAEPETHLLLASRLGYVASHVDLVSQINEVERMLNSFIASLSRKQTRRGQ